MFRVPWKNTANTHQWRTPLTEPSYCQFYMLSSLNLIIPLTGSWSQGRANFLDLQFNQIIAVDQSHRNKYFITSKRNKPTLLQADLKAKQLPPEYKPPPQGILLYSFCVLTIAEKDVEKWGHRTRFFLIPSSLQVIIIILKIQPPKATLSKLDQSWQSSSLDKGRSTLAVSFTQTHFLLPISWKSVSLFQDFKIMCPKGKRVPKRS